VAVRDIEKLSGSGRYGALNRTSHDRELLLVVEDGRTRSQAADILARGWVANDADGTDENAGALVFV